MYETDPNLKADSDYLQGMQCVLAALTPEFPASQYHPEGGELSNGRIKGGSFFSGAMFAVVPLGEGRALPLDRSEILACRVGVTPEVQRKIDEFVSSVRPFRLTWTSRNEVNEIECGRYSSIAEATADLPAAKARLEAQYPATADDARNLHDISAGTWRVVPVQHQRPVQKRGIAVELT